MHESVLAFGAAAITPEMVTGKAVLEVGSLNVNGSLRSYVEGLRPRSYDGIDIQEGPGVDRVADICALKTTEPFDLIICTEMLEHAPDWRAAIRNMKAALKPGGWLLLTTRSVGFPFHEYPGDHWRFSTADMGRIFADFYIEHDNDDPQAPGVFVLAQKKPMDTLEPVDLTTIEVHSMQTGVSSPIKSDTLNREPLARRPMFSIIHPSARPDKWAEVLAAWFRSCTQGDFEYILVCDKRWGFETLPTEPPESTGIIMGGAFGGNAFRAIWNTGRRCYVDAVNLGAQYATGDVLIVIADDQYPAQDWDFHLAEVLADSGKEVIEVSTGTPAEHERGILVMPILTRARFERLGYVLYPQYESMFADNDFCEAARKDDQIANARHLLFPHRHPYFDKTVESDAAYEAQNRPEAYQLGGAVLKARRESNFGAAMRKKKIAVLIPGESFSSQWVTNFMAMLSWVGQFFDYECHNAYCSNVYVARVGLARAAVASDADYVLWIDDDNVVTAENVKQLLIDLEGSPEIDFISGWCGCHSNVQAPGKVQTSVGFFGENDKIEGVDPVELAATQGLVKIDWTGFPLVLMRRSSLAKLDNPFAPILNPHNPYGFDSEDIAFSKRAREAGLKLACDPRVKVPHLKLRDADQISAPAGEFTSKENK
jgi:SAM-dependent methyltransferase